MTAIFLCLFSECTLTVCDYLDVELIRNNAAVGSQIASHLAKLSHHVASDQHPVAMSNKVDDIFSTKQRSITVTTADAAKINGPSPESYQFYAKESKKSANEKLAKRIVRFCHAVKMKIDLKCSACPEAG